MKSFYKSLILGMGGVLLLSGLAMAQTTRFNDGTCATLDTCGLSGGTNRLIEQSGSNFFFQEQVVIGGKLLNHTIVRGIPDGATGSSFSQETFTPGGAVQGATNTASTDALTFKQTLKAAGTVDSTDKMDNLGIINRTAEGMVNSTKIHINQSITDPTFGLNINLVTLTPNTGTATTGDFVTHIA